MPIRSWPDVAARDRHASMSTLLGRHQIGIRNADGGIAHCVACRTAFRHRVIDRCDRRSSVRNVEAARWVTSELAVTREGRLVPESELDFHFHRTDKRWLSRNGQRGCMDSRKTDQRRLSRNG
jgi:hypothetical protein